MSGVPYTFANATTTIALSNLDANFNTPVTIGNTTVGLGNTVTTLGNVTIAGGTLSTTNIAGGSANGVVYLNSSNVATANASVFALDGNGNLGLGVSPSAWESGAKVMQFSTAGAGGTSGNTGSIWARGDTLRLINAAYFNGSNYIYSATGVAPSFYFQQQGAHLFYVNSTTGTAGNTANGFTQAMTLDNSGNLLVGTTGTPSGYFPARFISYISGAGQNAINTYIDDNGGAGINSWVATASGTRTHINFYDGSVGSRTQRGSITSNGATTSYNVTSDRRLKSNIGNVTTSGTFIDSLIPRTFIWTSTGKSDIGFIADEYQSVLPSAVTGQTNATKEEEYEVTPAVKDEQGNITTPAVMGTRTVPVYQQVDFTTPAMIANMIAELQSLRKRVAALEAKVGV